MKQSILCVLALFSFSTAWALKPGDLVVDFTAGDLNQLNGVLKVLTIYQNGCFEFEVVQGTRPIPGSTACLNQDADLYFQASSIRGVRGGDNAAFTDIYDGEPKTYTGHVLGVFTKNPNGTGSQWALIEIGGYTSLYNFATDHITKAN